MPTLTSFSYLKQKVNKIKVDHEVATAGIAFMRLALMTIVKINEDEIEDSITDGGMDREIDAVYIDNKTIHVFTFKYTDEFKNTKKNYPENELDQFILAVDSILKGDLDKRTVNDAVWDKYQEILNLYEQGTPKSFQIYVVSNKLKPVSAAKHKLEKLIENYRIAEPIYYDQEDVVSLMIENKVDKTDGKLTFVEDKHFEKSDGQVKTIIGVIAATDLIELIKDPKMPDKVNENIFNENVRKYRKSHRVNKAIIESALSDDNYQFFYLNNGITILCEGCDYKPHRKNPVVPLYNLQIINGCQTSHSLFASYVRDQEKIHNVELLARVCIIKKNDPLSDNIKESSNSQIPVGSRDLHSNDLIQKKLQGEFEVLGYYYERKPNEFIDKPKKKVINNELLGQIYMSYYLDMPSEAKNNKALVFGERYDDIFDDEKVSGENFLQIYRLYLPLLKMKKEVQAKKRKKQKINEKEAFLSRATFHVLNVIKIIIEHQRGKIILKYKEKADIQRECIKLFDEKNVDKNIRKAIAYVADVVNKEMKKRGDLYTHDKFFKEISTNKIISNYVSDKLGSIKP